MPLDMEAVMSLVSLMREDCPELINLDGGVRYRKRGGIVEVLPVYARGCGRSADVLFARLGRIERVARGLFLHLATLMLGRPMGCMA